MASESKSAAGASLSSAAKLSSALDRPLSKGKTEVIFSPLFPPTFSFGLFVSVSPTHRRLSHNAGIAQRVRVSLLRTRSVRSAESR
jgi:hypothetical protein